MTTTAHVCKRFAITVCHDHTVCHTKGYNHYDYGDAETRKHSAFAECDDVKTVCVTLADTRPLPCTNGAVCPNGCYSKKTRYACCDECCEWIGNCCLRVISRSDTELVVSDEMGHHFTIPEDVVDAFNDED